MADRPRIKHTILVLDDEPDVVRSVKDLLRLDYRVFTATDVEEAMKIMEAEDIHIVMTDQRMPGTSGVEFLSKVRAKHPEAIRLLFTGYADIRAVIDAINQGSVYRYINKPWDPDELQMIIREASEKYELIIEREQLLVDLSKANEKLTTANKELHEANELKSAFIQVASHELRTPLTILVGLTNLATRAPGTQGPLKEWLTRIDSAAKRVQKLVDQIVSMLAAGQFDQPMNRQPTDLKELLDHAVSDVKPFIELRRQKLEETVTPDLKLVEIDREMIRDSVDHLLLNAIKFTPDEGKIAIEASGGTDGEVQIRISDSGVGMNTSETARLFQPFFTGFDVSRHSSGHFEFNRRGIGLGLSVVKAFVDRHGGRIDVRSEPGKGTTFTITLPAKAPAESSGAPA
ncbi:MAG TPA: hybrid sensor histidine kinase/response regulator [Tepidisphaeraceae bacterium]|nr:hybrid sensor histidine kinase/response regulator [Tepidisphaeraceae bacterium]